MDNNKHNIGKCGLDNRGSILTACRPALGPTHPPIQWVPGALCLGVKWLWREADHSPPSSAEVRNAWSYTSTPPGTTLPYIYLLTIVTDF